MEIFTANISTISNFLLDEQNTNVSELDAAHSVFSSCSRKTQSSDAGRRLLCTEWPPMDHATWTRSHCYTFKHKTCTNTSVQVFIIKVVYLLFLYPHTNIWFCENNGPFEMLEISHKITTEFFNSVNWIEWMNVCVNFIHATKIFHHGLNRLSNTTKIYQFLKPRLGTFFLFRGLLYALNVLVDGQFRDS